MYGHYCMSIHLSSVSTLPIIVHCFRGSVGPVWVQCGSSVVQWTERSAVPLQDALPSMVGCEYDTSNEYTHDTTT